MTTGQFDPDDVWSKVMLEDDWPYFKIVEVDLPNGRTERFRIIGYARTIQNEAGLRLRSISDPSVVMVAEPDASYMRLVTP